MGIHIKTTARTEINDRLEDPEFERMKDEPGVSPVLSAGFLEYIKR